MSMRTANDGMKLTRVSNAVAAGTSTINCSSIDMAGFESVMFVAALGTITAGAQVHLKVQGSSDDADADAFADLIGTGVPVHAGEDNQLVGVEIVKPGLTQRYLRSVLVRDGANSVVDSVVAMQFGAGTKPTTHDSTTVARTELHLAPAEGTSHTTTTDDDHDDHDDDDHDDDHDHDDDDHDDDMSTLTVQTAPTALPVTLQRAYEYLALQEDVDQNEVKFTIQAARDLFESFTGRTLIDTIYDYGMKAFEDVTRLPRVPVDSITSISYYDDDDSLQTLVVDDYTILVKDNQRAELHRKDGVSWPAIATRPDAVTIRFTAGYGTASTDVDKSCQLALLVLTSHFWVNRDALITGTIVSELPWMLRSLLNNLRPNWVAGAA